jgi:hypothetical protein
MRRESTTDIESANAPAVESAPVDSKRIGERRHFEWFCEAAGLPLIPGSIEQPDSPAPDVIADFQGLGRIAFELVRLNDPDHLTRFRLMQQMPDFLDRQFAALPAGRHQALTARYIDAHIIVDFHGAATLAQRRGVLPYVWDILEGLPAGHEGKVDLYGREPPAELAMIWINRIKTGGRPRFRSQTMGYVLPLRVEEIERKLLKRYSTEAPLELLAYVENGEVAYQSDVDQITEIVGRCLPESQFQRVWVYEGLLRRIGMRLP